MAMAPAPQATHPHGRNVIYPRSIDAIRRIKVVIIGAGISGICAAIKLQQRAKELDLVIYDKNPEVGGTWYENDYPGIACDIPSHCYQLSFESNPSWSTFYARGAEILQYWKDIVAKYDLRRKYMKLSHRAIQASWDDETKKWNLELENLETGETFTDSTDVLIQGIGALNEWQWPQIPGIQDFKGTLLHSAHWDSKYQYKGKNIAVIGAGSSGIQITPSIQPDVARLDHYIRGPTWISPTFVAEEIEKRNEHGGNFQYSTEEIEEWKKNPELYLTYRKLLEQSLQSGYKITLKGSDMQKGARETFIDLMHSRLSKKPEIAESLIPSFSPVCKRLTPGPGYLEALTASNVTAIHTPISRITSTGIETTDGTHREVDAIIAATGFDTSYLHRLPIYGQNNLLLSEKWKDRPSTYLTMTIDGFPNFFMSMGPNSAMGTGNLLLVIESFASYISQIVAKMQRENILTIQPKPSAVSDFSDFCDEYFEGTVFSEECSSWYKGGKKIGRVDALWPGSSLHAFQALQKPRWEDFDYEYGDGNGWGWFGNGWAEADRVDGADRAWYLEGGSMVYESLDGKKMVEEKEDVELDIDLVGWW